MLDLRVWSQVLVRAKIHRSTARCNHNKTHVECPIPLNYAALAQQQPQPQPGHSPIRPSLPTGERLSTVTSIERCQRSAMDNPPSPCSSSPAFFTRSSNTRRLLKKSEELGHVSTRSRRWPAAAPHLYASPSRNSPRKINGCDAATNAPEYICPTHDVVCGGAQGKQD
jgi:hypothetical protein